MMKRKQFRHFFLALAFLANFNSNLFSAGSTRVVNAVGITGGVTFSSQRWFFVDPNYTQRNKFILGFNGSLRAELFYRDYTALVSEIQYNQKGTREKDALGNKYKNQVDFICFNNFYKIHYELDAFIPYFLIGPRVEYAFIQSTASPVITSNFRKINLTASVGLGAELITYGDVKFFSEMHFNPDIIKSYSRNNLSIRTTAYEIRLGAKYTFSSNRRAPCPAVYK